MTQITTFTELPPEDRELLDEARRATKLAYAPYSRFKVGAALRTASGAIVIGANQENASYPLCMCGERVALYNSAMLYPDDPIITVAIAVESEHTEVEPAAPCGACLQVLSEYEMRQNKPIRLLLQGDSEKVMDIKEIREALPLQFDGEFLRRP